MLDAPIILFESDACLVVNKTGGLLSQAPPGVDSLEHRLREYLIHHQDNHLNQNETGKHGFLNACHRLDRPASGAILFARQRSAAQRLGRQFEERNVEKTYWALVAGRPAADRGTWTDFMRKIPGQAHAEIVSPNHPQAQLAMLDFRVLKHPLDEGEDVSWLEIELSTGRTHQIRLQAASRGHWVLGDEQYGAEHGFGEVVDDVRRRWIALHARRLCFRDPRDDKRVDVTAPLFDCWKQKVTVDKETHPSSI